MGSEEVDFLNKQVFFTYLDILLGDVMVLGEYFHSFIKFSNTKNGKKIGILWEIFCINSFCLIYTYYEETYKKFNNFGPCDGSVHG